MESQEINALLLRCYAHVEHLPSQRTEHIPQSRLQLCSAIPTCCARREPHDVLDRSMLLENRPSPSALRAKAFDGHSHAYGVPRMVAGARPDGYMSFIGLDTYDLSPSVPSGGRSARGPIS
jgi:hypothetical protein